MKALVVSFALVFLASNAFANQARDIDLDKINQVISEIGASLIEGDELFTELTASFDPANTDLKNRKAAGELTASVRGTAWAQSETSLRVTGFAKKVGESTRNGEEIVDTEFGLGAYLSTPVISLVQFGWKKFGCPSENTGELLSVYDFIQNQVCPGLNEKIPALSGGEALVELVDQTVGLVKASIQDYLVLMTKKLNEAQDSETKSAIEALLFQANEMNKEVERLVVNNNGSSIELSISFDDLMGQPLHLALGATASEELLSLDMNADFAIYKETFEDLFSYVETVLVGLQDENEEMITDLKSMLQGYLEMVKSIISEE